MRSAIALRFGLAALTMVLAACATTNTQTSNKWRLEFSGNAESDGVIVVQLLGVGEIIAEVPTQITRGTGENQVARQVSATLRGALDANRYEVEVDDGEDVLIKRRGSGPDFEVRVLSNSVRGVRINTQRE